jgi:hypothetical protein
MNIYFLSKKTLLPLADNTIASTIGQSGIKPDSFAAKPTENITLLSVFKSAAVLHALPTAIPKSLELKKQGTSCGFVPQFG